MKLLDSVRVHHINLFTFDKSTRTLTTFITDIKPQSGSAFSILYEDAVDLGFTILNPNTGNSVTFYLERDFFTEAGELAGWVLKPITACGLKEVIVFND